MNEIGLTIGEKVALEVTINHRIEQINHRVEVLSRCSSVTVAESQLAEIKVLRDKLKAGGLFVSRRED